MNIILKPMGIVALGTALVTLTFLALRQQKSSAPTVTPPASSTTSTVTASTASADAPMVVYDGALRNGWTNFSWGKNDFADTRRVPGSNCIRVESGPFEAVYFHHDPMNVSAYDRVSFRINGGEKGGQKLKLVAQFDDNGKAKAGTDYLLSAPTANHWTTVTLPLKQLGVEGQKGFTGFWIQEAVGNKTMPAYYVDKVRCLRPGDSAE